METMLNVLQNLAFPMAACLFLAYYVNQQTKLYREDIQKLTIEQSRAYREDVKILTEDYKKSIGEFRETLEKNTMVLNALENKLGRSRSTASGGASNVKNADK